MPQAKLTAQKRVKRRSTGLIGCFFRCAHTTSATLYRPIPMPICTVIKCVHAQATSSAPYNAQSRLRSRRWARTNAASKPVLKNM